MTSGIFSAAFASNVAPEAVGCGVAIFRDNTIHGGDQSFYYRGKYKFNDLKQIIGTIDVVKYSTLQHSIFGPTDGFRLILSGHIVRDDRNFEMSGYVEGQPSLKIQILLNKMEELIEA